MIGANSITAAATSIAPGYEPPGGARTGLMG
jgi:hypothetical protein